MKLLNCILFASLALSANLVHADASCAAAPGFKRGSNVEALKHLDNGTASKSTPAETSSNASR